MFDNQTPEEMFLEAMKAWAEENLLCGEDLYAHLSRIGRVKGEDAVKPRLTQIISKYMTEDLGFTVENQ